MDKRKKKDQADPPFAPGGAVDDLTPPTMQGVMPTLHVSPPTNAGVAPSNGGATVVQPPDGPPTMTAATQIELERTMVGPPPTYQQKPNNTPRHPDKSSSPGNTGISPSVGGPNAATFFNDIPTQDLSNEQLLRDAPRVESGGQMCPSLNGIPLLFKLGQGGMGAVYYGVHPRLRSEVAVKVLPFHLAAQDPGMIQRFFREAQIAAKVRSPHLVSVIDVNEESGLFFLVMEYVSGVSMGQYLKKQIEEGRVGLSELDAIDSSIAACMGLDAAHQQGIIHRDLKPDNIMLPYKSRQHKTYDIRNAKLMDLGLARSEEGNQSLTGVQAAMGTPGYMAPEQALDAKTADKRSDVFGMGATIYALLAGRPPFKGDVVMKVLMATMHEPHPPLAGFRPDLSQGLIDIVDRCLDKNPENRFVDARQLIRALKAARKVIHPDSTFGGEDEGGSDTDLSSLPALSHLAPKIGETSRVAVGVKPNRIPLYAGIAAAVLIAIGLAVGFGRGGTKVVVDDPGLKPPVEAIKELPENTKKFVLEGHGTALQGVYDALGVKNFDAAEFKFNSGYNADQQFTKQLPALVTDWEKARKDIDSAKRADQFDNTIIAINLALKSNNIDEALRQVKKLEPETPSQVEESTRLNSEISRAEKKIRNKGEFNKTLIEARNDALKIDQKLALVTKALELIPDEPHALELQKNYKAIQATEINNQQFALQMAKAQDLFVSNNFAAANKAITEAKRLKPENKDAQAFAKQIFASLGDAEKKEIGERSRKDAFEAFKRSQEFFAKKDNAKALEQIIMALANVSDDDQYISQKKVIQLVIAEEERVAELTRRKAAFKDYFKEANDNLEYASDVKKAASLGIAMERINDAKLLKLDDPNLLNRDDPKSAAELGEMLAGLKALEGKIVVRQNDLRTRKQYDDWIIDSTRILDENDVDGKMANIEAGLKEIDDALKIAEAGKVVNAKESAAAADLKKKLEAKKEEIAIRDQKRVKVAALVAQGDASIQNEKYADALQTFKSAELIARELTVVEKNAVQDKMKTADMKIKSLKEIDVMINAADKLVTSEKFEDASAKLADAQKIMDDKRFAVKKAEIEAKKTALNETVKSSFDAAIAAFSGQKLDDAVQTLARTAEAHPTRTDLAAALTSFREIQRIDSDIAQKLPDLRARYGVVSKIQADTKQQRARADEAFEKLPKLTASVADDLAKTGMATIAQVTSAYAKRADDLLTQAKNNVIILEGMYREEEARKRPPPPVQPEPGPKPKVKGGEVEPDL